MVSMNMLIFRWHFEIKNSDDLSNSFVSHWIPSSATFQVCIFNPLWTFMHLPLRHNFILSIFSVFNINNSTKKINSIYLYMDKMKYGWVSPSSQIWKWLHRHRHIMTQSLKGPINFGLYRISLELDTYVSDTKKCWSSGQKIPHVPLSYCLLETPRTRNIWTLITSPLCYIFTITRQTS